MNWEYVASGLSHTRIAYSKFDEPDDLANEVLHMIRTKIDAIQGKQNHKFSVLFNACVEAVLGPRLRKNLGSHVHQIYADSGGLQIITLGKKVTPEIKRKVYQVQGTNADIGMSFDEIPLVTTGRSTFHDMSSRFYDPTLLEQKARETGQNLKEQIEYMLEMGTKCRPMLILQGNDLESYQRWVDIICETIGEENYKHVCGISSGSAAIGLGALEDTKRYFILSQLKYPEAINSKHIHILGVGTSYRLLPLIRFVQNGLFPADMKFSYDSTTHTSGLSTGNYYFDGAQQPIGKFKGTKFYRMFNDMNNNLELLGLPTVDEVPFYEYILTPGEKNKTYVDELHLMEKYHVLWSFFLSQAYNAMAEINDATNKKSVFNKLTHRKKMYVPMEAMKGIRDSKDYEYWYAKYGPMLVSKAVQNREAVSTLEEFF